tara:strand:- start:495 stop:929 length:435 start_codon:yes stop_codon:yes gene_type:complete
MNIYLFDFDNTIVKLPYQETIEYLDQKESLDPKLNFKLIEKTKQDYLKALDYDPDGLFLILSNRIVEVKDSLNTLLKKLGYEFEDYYLIDDDDRNKGNRVRKILDRYKNCKSVKFWEDKDKHINSVTDTMKDYPEIEFEVIKTR